MQDNDYSGTALLDFLEYAGEKGLLKLETARSRRVAVKKILSVADADEAADMRQFDLDAVFHRFQNRNSQEYKPESLGVYRSRFATALKDFLNWKENPSAFKTATVTRNVAPKKKESKPAPNLSAPWKCYFGANGNTGPQTTTGSGRSLSSPIVMPVPIKDTAVTIAIENIPYDLTKTESEKIKKFLHSLEHMLDAFVTDNNEEESDEQEGQNQ